MEPLTLLRGSGRTSHFLGALNFDFVPEKNWQKITGIWVGSRVLFSHIKPLKKIQFT
jgi:hypothetical protein